jgi:hypothetical protein
MAKAKKGQKATPKGKNVPPTPDPKARHANLHLRATQEWRDWLDGLASHYHMTVSALIDFALTKIAREGGYKDKPPKR